MSQIGKTRIIQLTENNREQLLQEAAQVVKNGSLLIFPTDTVYGIGGAAFSPSVFRALASAKRARDSKSYVLLVENLEVVNRTAGRNLKSSALSLAKKFWPGPLTIIWYANPDISAKYNAPDGSLGYRIPNHDFLRALLKVSGGLLWATSANRSGSPPPSDFQEIDKDVLKQAALVIDAGEKLTGVASTVVDARMEPVKILREGAIPAAKIHAFLHKDSSG
ncbi:threonylcarbamoyl-AMP synthase [bacterium]|nr:threonylcarbamoyl-AMP synthase [bacterium]